MLLSICVPTYDRAERLERLLATLAADPAVQAGVPVLVSDNASPDGTQEVLERFGSALDLRSYRQRENVGGVENVHWLALNAPETDYVWFLADDDLPAPGGIAAALELLAEHEPRWLHLPHLWVDDGGVVHLASPCPERVEVFPTSHELFLAYHHWLTFISASVVRRERLQQIVAAWPTGNEWAPLIWYFLTGLDGRCVVAGDRLVVGTPGTSWDDRRALVLTDRVLEAYDEGLCAGLSEEEYARSLDGRYENGAFFDCWSAVPIEKLVAAVERFPQSRQLRSFLWVLARQQGRRDAIEALDRAGRTAGADEVARAHVEEGEAHFAAGDVAGAAESFLAAIREHPTHAPAWNDLGVAFHAAGRAGEALDAFEVAVELVPGDEDALTNRAAVAQALSC